MLVLTRREDQTITIGDPKDEDVIAIEITVLEVRGDQVRLGIIAPRDLAVDRKEIWEAKREAAGLSVPGREPAAKDPATKEPATRKEPATGKEPATRKEPT